MYNDRQMLLMRKIIFNSIDKLNLKCTILNLQLVISLHNASTFLPSAAVVAERLCFHKRLSGGSVHPPGRPPGHTHPLGRHPPGHTPLDTHTPWTHTPPGHTHPLDTPLDGLCSGRYVFYWNAFLLIFYF